jgi:hypothetical protein
MSSSSNPLLQIKLILIMEIIVEVKVVIANNERMDEVEIDILKS